MSKLRDYAVISGAYWVFTVTDGALRMLVLFYLYGQGYTPLSIASLFVVYELSGVVTNSLGAYLGARFGLKKTLSWGLTLQVLVCAMLMVDPRYFSALYLSVIQLGSGVAKDLTKMSAKSYIKLLVPEEQGGRLLKWVAALTGSKNALKGVGFFVGSWGLHALGLRGSALAMTSALLVAVGVASLMLPDAAGKAKTARISSLWAKDTRLNRLAAARLFLFGARDLWFALGLPLFLHAQLDWSYAEVGAFMAAWVIGYGLVQAVAPRFLGAGGQDESRRPPGAALLSKWTAGLVLPLALIAIGLAVGWPAGPTLVIGLLMFGALFATNSALHSFLVIHYADRDKVAMNVGFYYTANAAGRLVGTVLSGACYELAGKGSQGLLACIVTALVFVLGSTFASLRLVRAEKSYQLQAETRAPAVAG